MSEKCDTAAVVDGVLTPAQRELRDATAMLLLKTPHEKRGELCDQICVGVLAALIRLHPRARVEWLREQLRSYVEAIMIRVRQIEASGGAAGGTA